MEHQEQVECLKRVLEYETQVASLKKALNDEESKTFGKQNPIPPVKRTVQFTPPTVMHGCKINWLEMLLPAGVNIALIMLTNSLNYLISGFSFVFESAMAMFIPATVFIWPLIYYFAIYRKNKEAAIEKVINSEEYKQQYAIAKAEADKLQQNYDEEYAAAKNEFDTVTIPKFQQEYAEWKKEKDKRINQLNQELIKAQNDLTELYEQTRIVPVQYRSIYALQYIYNMISTSDYDVHQAIDSFDKSEQRRLDTLRLQEQRHANALATEHNDLLDEQNYIAEKARRDANMASVVSAVQRHNTNKSLKKLIK